MSHSQVLREMPKRIQSLQITGEVIGENGAFLYRQRHKKEKYSNSASLFSWNNLQGPGNVRSGYCGGV